MAIVSLGVVFQNCDSFEVANNYSLSSARDGTEVSDNFPTEPPRENLENYAARNREIVILRVKQFANLIWKPKSDVPAENSKGSDFLPEGITIKGPPYSSVKTLGRVINQDISYETFLSMVDNSKSDLYTLNLENHPLSNSTGRTVVGAVCSNFLAYGFGWPFSPTTSMIDRDYRRWGFRSRMLTGEWTEDDVAIGDVLVTDGGGHIELVIEVDDSSITTLDQAKRGPRLTLRQKNNGENGFLQYAEGRRYNLYRYDYAAMDEQKFEPSEFVSLPGEDPPSPTFNQIVQLNRGTRSVYFAGETVKIHLPSENIRNLIITRNNKLISKTAVVGKGQVVEVPLSIPGNYEAYGEMDDLGMSDKEIFAVTRVSAALSRNVASVNENVVVHFSTENARAQMIVVEDVKNNSISRGLLKTLTPEEIESGRAIFNLPRKGEFRVRVRAIHSYGATYSEPLDLLPLTITD